MISTEKFTKVKWEHTKTSESWTTPIFIIQRLLSNEFLDKNAIGERRRDIATQERKVCIMENYFGFLLESNVK